MTYRLATVDAHNRELKALAKKYPSLASDYEAFLDDLEQNPTQGKRIGKGCYKIRFTTRSKVGGKSGGFRIITCVKIIETTVYLISIYDKSEQDNIDDSVLKQRIQSIAHLD